MLPHVTPAEAALLDLAGRHYRYEANREAAVWDELGLTLMAFWQSVNALLDTERALAHDAVLVRRLQRRRAAMMR